MNDVLPDVLQTGLTVIFCGTAASEKSADIGAYYGNPTNAFWKTLYEVGMTPHQLDPIDFHEVLAYGIGLTDVAKKAVGNDDVLSQADFDGVGLTQKIETYQPQILAFTSKRAYRAWAGVPSRHKVAYGCQKKTIEQTKIYVLPSPSGSARGYWDIEIWQTLANRYQQLRIQDGKHD